MEKKLLLATLPIVTAIYILCIFLVPSKTVDVHFEPYRGSFLGSHTAPHKIVLFQEFACPICRDFHETVLPWMISTYVNTGEASLHLVPVALLEESFNPFSAARSVMDVSLNHLHAFLNFFFTENFRDALTKDPEELLTDFSDLYPDFPLSEAIKSLKTINFDNERETSNLEIEKLYGDEIHLPTLLIDGNRVTRLTKEGIIKHLEKKVL